MAVPSAITDLSTTVASNSPAGSESPSLIDDYLRAQAGFLAQMYSGNAPLLSSVAGTDTITGTVTPTPTAYAAGQVFRFISAGANTTTAVTLNVSSLGAKSVTKLGANALAAGDIPSGAVVQVVYDGTRFQIIGLTSQIAAAINTMTSPLTITVNGTTPITADTSGNISLPLGTANQVQYLNGSKVLSGSANLTFDGTTLTPNALTVTNAVTLNGGTANGVPYLNASKVLTSGSALTFDGTNLGLGVTPQTWFSGYRVFQFGDVGSLSRSSGGAVMLGNNSYVTAAGADTYLTTGYSSRYYQYNGQHVWQTAPSGTAGAAITFTQAMTLDASSNLILGGSTAAAQYVLNVTGGNSGARQVGVLAYKTATVGPSKFMDVNVTAGFDNYYDMRFYTDAGSGTPTERARIDSSGNFMVGGGVANAKNTTLGNADVLGIRYAADGGSALLSWFNNAGTRLWAIGGGIATAQDELAFVRQSTTVAKFDSSGNLLIGGTSTTPTGSFSVVPNIASVGCATKTGHISGAASGTTYAEFFYNGTYIGGITQNGTTAVAYNTSSDYRLKQNVRDANAKRFGDVKFHDFEWIDGRHDCGVIAHELQAIYPDLVVGDKDAVDEEGKDQYQQVNYIGLIPRMGTVVQQLMAKVEALEARIAALEAK